MYYSHWILSDPLFVAFSMAALWALEGADSDDAMWWWIVGGVAAVGLAYFTRSAGLPLLVALFVWFALRKRWRALGGSALAVGIPALLWWLRGRGESVAEYGTEFWMVDPYQPALGTVGIGGLVSRAFNNSWAYVSAHGPGGILGGSGRGVAAFGVLITALALFGWFRSSRERVGVAELFLPLYAGLILLWPEVWSGDRFALPLYPLFFLFAGLTLRTITSKVGGMGGSALTVAVVSTVLLPAGRDWMASVHQASTCADATRSGGAWACYGSGIGDFATAAEWMGEALPEGSAVMTRKPRLFYVLSGIPSRVFPFDDDPAVQLTEADRLGARYLLLDQLGRARGAVLGWCAPAVSAGVLFGAGVWERRVAFVPAGCPSSCRARLRGSERGRRADRRVHDRFRLGRRARRGLLVVDVDADSVARRAGPVEERERDAEDHMLDIRAVVRIDILQDGSDHGQAVLGGVRPE